MTFVTLTYNGAEMSLGDWGISQATREVSNQAHDHFACDIMLAADATDPLPYGAQITLRIGRTPASGTGLTPGGLPISGISSWTGGTVWFVGYRVDNFRTGSPDLEKFDYKFAGPWEFFFERLVFQKLWWTYNGTQNVADWRSQVVLGLSVNALVGANDTVPDSDATNLMSIRQQVAEIIAYVINQTTADYGSPQLQSDNLTAAIDGTNYDLYETPGTNLIIPDYIAGYAASGKTSANSGSDAANMQTVLRAPLDSVNDITCAEAMRRMLRWIGPMGSPVVWFDYTTTPPTLKISTRDQLPSVTLAFLANNAGFKIKRRDDLIPNAICLKFRVAGSWNGQNYVQIIKDIVSTVSGTVVEGVGLTGELDTIQSFATGSPALVGSSANSATMQALEAAGRDFAAVTATIDMEGNSSNATTCTIATVAVNTSTPAGGGSALAFWQNVFPELADISGPDFFSGSSVTVVDDNNNPVDTSNFQYLLTRGQVAPWMLSGNSAGGAPAQSVRAHITATFTGTENNDGVATGHVQHHPKHATVTLLTIPGGTYVNQQITPGEIIPYGLAGYIYNIEKIPQYEGTFAIQETEITDLCPLGNNLNLSGSLSEWAAMQACIQQIRYDLVQGRTILSFGPAAHLGARDFVERLRVNRGPRWFNLNGANVQNSPNQNGAQLGQDVSQLNPSHGPKKNDQDIWPISIADLAAHAAAYATANAGVPGATHDTRTSGQPLYGGNTASSGTGFQGQGGGATNPGLVQPPTPALPTIFLSDGSGGTPGANTIRISVSDLLSKGIKIWLQEYQCNFDFGDGAGCVAAYVVLLGSYPYKTSIHA
jgi:hypothetical protein